MNADERLFKVASMREEIMFDMQSDAEVERMIEGEITKAKVYQGLVKLLADNPVNEEREKLIMKCKGKYEDCGENCPNCGRFMDDCEGHPDYYWNDNNIWVEIGGENET